MFSVSEDIIHEKELADMGLDDYSVAFCGELRVAEAAEWPVTVTFRKSYGMILTGSGWGWTEVESGNTVVLFAEYPIALLDKKPDVLTGFTLSGGNVWIIIIGAVVIIGGIAAAVIVGKKRKKAA